MPIVFEQPQPVMPNISSGYGAAQQYSADLPTLAKMQESAAQLQLQARMAGGGGGGGGGGGASPAAMQQQQYQTEAGLTSQAWAEQAKQNDLNVQAQNQQWLSQQDMTQQENLRLQQLQGGLAAADTALANGTLTPAQYNQSVMDMKTPYSMLKAKQVATQTRLEQSQQKKVDQQIQSDAAHEATKDKLNAQTIDDKIQWRPDQNILAEADAEVDPVDPSLSGIPALAAKAIRDREVIAKVKEKNGMIPFAMEKDGTWKQEKGIDRSKSEGDQEKRDAAKHDKGVKAFEAADKSYQRKVESYDKAFREERQKLQDADHTKEGLAEIAAGTKRAATTEELDAAAASRVKIPKPGEAPKLEDHLPKDEEKPKEKGAKKGRPTPAPTSDSPVTPPVPGASPNPTSPTTGTPAANQPQATQPQRSNVAILDDALKAPAVQQLPPAVRAFVNAAIDHGKELLAKGGAKGYDGLDEKQKLAYDRNQEAVKKALAANPVAPQSGPRPPAGAAGLNQVPGLFR